MTEDEINEGWKVIGDKIREAVDRMRDQGAELYREAGEIERLWGYQDWGSLYNMDVLTSSDMKQIDKLRKEWERGITEARIRPIAGPGEVLLDVSCRWRAEPEETWTYSRAVPATLSPEMCLVLAEGMLFANDWSADHNLQIQVLRDLETIKDWS